MTDVTIVRRPTLEQLRPTEKQRQCLRDMAAWHKQSEKSERLIGPAAPSRQEKE